MIVKICYNVFFHPLRSYPGPLLAQASLIEYQIQTLKGYPHLWLDGLHKEYGPVVRFSPNQLSFIEPGVWKDVYGHRATVFHKETQFYGPDPFGGAPGIFRANNDSHARQRKVVGYAFSDKALKDQESLLKGHVRTLTERLEKIATSGSTTDMVKWFNFTTFDIMASTLSHS